MSHYLFTAFQTWIGWIGILGSHNGIRRIVLGKSSRDDVIESLVLDSLEVRPDDGFFEEIRGDIEKYLSGRVTHFTAALDLPRTSIFYLRSWEICRTIPAGETRSYSWLACNAGNPKAVRAAGQAMANNPISIVIPCHRIIASDGKLGGYSGGLDLKKILLNLEGNMIL